jgi:nucleoside-diphosphate-sugar epimerase
MGTYLVTGAAGFIGSHLITHLLKQGNIVKAIDNLTIGNEDNINNFKENTNFTFFNVDIRDISQLRKVMEDVEFVLHHAALASVQESIKDPLVCNDVNVLGTLNVLVAARDAGVKRVVFASSAAVYGDGVQGKKTEEMLLKPLSPYAVSKIAGEQYCRAFSKVYGLPTICLRYFNVFGERQSSSSAYAAVVPLFIKAIRDNKSPAIFGSGKQTRDFVHVDNIVHANILACRSSILHGVYNIGSGSTTNLLELIDVINGITGMDVTPLYTDERNGDIKNSTADISLAQKELGYATKIDFKEGMRRTINQ